MASRRMPKATSPWVYSPNESGPRCTMTSHMARTRSGLGRSPRVHRISPAIPHMRRRSPSGRQALALQRRRQIAHRSQAGADAEPRQLEAVGIRPQRPRPRRGRGPEAVALQEIRELGAEVAVLAAGIRVAEMLD